MMPLLPNAVPHDEWEVHLRSVHGVLEDLTRRVRRLEEHGPVLGTAGGVKALAQRYGHERSWPQSCELASQLVELHRVCTADLATQRGLDVTATRLDVHLEAGQRRTEAAIEDLRSYLNLQLETMREQRDAAVGVLTMGLASAGKEIDSLRSALEAEVGRTRATHPTRTDLQEALTAVRDERSSAEQALRAALDDLGAAKASSHDLQEARQALSADHAKLREVHTETRQRVDRGAEEFLQFQRYARTTFATQEDLADVKSGMRSLQEDARRAADDGEALRAALARVDASLSDGLERISDGATEVLSLTRRANELESALRVARNEFAARADALEAALKALDRRERSSWERFALERR